MNWYSQLDPRWRDKFLGQSGLTCREAGCHIVSLANIFLHSGREETPGELIDNLPNAFPNPKEGIDIHQVMDKYPMSYSLDKYALIKGISTVGDTKHLQFIAKMPDGTIVNSFQQEGYPENFVSLASWGLEVQDGNRP